MSLFYHESLQFVTSFWQKEEIPSCWYLIYRWLNAGIIMFNFLVSFFDNDNFKVCEKWFLYASHWTAVTCLITSLWGAIIVSIWSYEYSRGWEYTKKSKALTLYRVYWILHVISTDCVFQISICYWTFIKNVPINTIVVHSNNCAVMIADLILVGFPVQIQHFYITLSLNIIYVIFNFLYFAFGGTDSFDNRYIYEEIDWNKPSLAVINSSIVISIGVATHVAVYAIYKLKELIKLYAPCYPFDPEQLQNSREESLQTLENINA